MKKKSKEKWIDDGRVIADMNVDGISHTMYKNKRRKHSDEFGQSSKTNDSIKLSKGELRSLKKGISLAFIAAMGIFIAVLTLIMLFISKVWFS